MVTPNCITTLRVFFDVVKMVVKMVAKIMKNGKLPFTFCWFGETVFVIYCFWSVLGLGPYWTGHLSWILAVTLSVALLPLTAPPFPLNLVSLVTQTNGGSFH